MLEIKSDIRKQIKDPNLVTKDPVYNTVGGH